MLELARYVVLNPVRAGMVATAGEWPWSSYRAMVGKECAPDWLATRWILTGFGETTATAVAAYVRFVTRASCTSTTPWENVKHQVFLRSDVFVDAMRSLPAPAGDLREVPQARARPLPKPLAHFAQQCADRDSAIAAAYASGGYTLKEIGDSFGLHYSRVSEIVRLAESARQKAKEKT